MTQSWTALDEFNSAMQAVPRGTWSIVRKGRLRESPRIRQFMRYGRQQESAAREAWGKIDVRQGWAALVDPNGVIVARQSGPFGVRGRGRW